MANDVLEVSGLTKAFGGKTVVDDVSFEVRRGEMFGFLGPNGSGKTTTIRMCLGIMRANSGSVRVLGSRPDLGILKRVGYLPEERGLTRKVKVVEILRFLGRLKGMSAAARRSGRSRCWSASACTNTRTSRSRDCRAA